MEQAGCYRDLVLHSSGSWLNGLCMTVVSASGAEPEVRAGSREGKMDVKWGEKGQMRTYMDKLGAQKDEGAWVGLAHL